jgi:hypothetical protein
MRAFAHAPRTPLSLRPPTDPHALKPKPSCQTHLKHWPPVSKAVLQHASHQRLTSCCAAHPTASHPRQTHLTHGPPAHEQTLRGHLHMHPTLHCACVHPQTRMHNFASCQTPPGPTSNMGPQLPYPCCSTPATSASSCCAAHQPGRSLVPRLNAPSS